LAVQFELQPDVHELPHTVATLFTHEDDHFGEGHLSFCWHFVATRLTHVEFHAVPLPEQQLGWAAQTAATHGSQLALSLPPVVQ